MLRKYNCNLHVHTCLSPCGDLDMHPSAIVKQCLESRLDIIAICDHNASENVPHVMKAAADTPLTVIPGMEMASREEVHLLALFESMEQLFDLQDLVYANLTGENDEKVFGIQAIVNEAGEVEGFNERLLIGATDLSLSDAVEAIHARGGLAVACHIDRPSFSVISQLGFVPREVPFDALEISARLDLKSARERFPELERYPFITSSDAHFLHDIGKTCTEMFLQEASLDEIRRALEASGGRYILE
ncbi:MAG TPA: PHP domain-containing protein [Deltaproteobacteria bacterium]|nr:PHP domain-containing protein [Deltaproteobacteria bacterium]